MARLARIDIVGLPQHIVVRGVDRQPCFFRQDDKALYVRLLADAAVRCSAAIHAFVLMTNHVHILATPLASGAVSAMMHRMGACYVRRINGLYGRTGTLFEGRFRSSLVQTERYLLACMRYIELNPVRARIVERPEAYSWSSYRQNAGFEPIRWLTPHPEFQGLAATAEARARAWQDLVWTAVADDELTAIRSHLNRNRALGDRRFQDQIGAMLGRRVHIMPRGRPSHDRIN